MALQCGFHYDFHLEQERGIEPPYSAWEADVLPLNYSCIIGGTIVVILT
jgi:hypothetical protein